MNNEEIRYLYSVYPKAPIRRLPSVDIGPVLMPKSLSLTLEDVKACIRFGATLYRRFANEGKVERVYLSSAERLHQAKYMTEKEFAELNAANDVVVDDAPVVAEKEEAAVVVEEVVEEQPVVEEVVEEAPVVAEEEVAVVEEEHAPVVEEVVEESTPIEEETVVEESPVAVEEEVSTTEEQQPQQHYKKQQIQFQYNKKKNK